MKVELPALILLPFVVNNPSRAFAPHVSGSVFIRPPSAHSARPHHEGNVHMLMLILMLMEDVSPSDSSPPSPAGFTHGYKSSVVATSLCPSSSCIGAMSCPIFQADAWQSYAAACAAVIRLGTHPTASPRLSARCRYPHAH